MRVHREAGLVMASSAMLATTVVGGGRLESEILRLAQVHSEVLRGLSGLAPFHLSFLSHFRVPFLLLFLFFDREVGGGTHHFSPLHL